MSAQQSEDTTEISSNSFVLSHSKFIISNFFVDKECAEKWRNSNTIWTGFKNSVFQADFTRVIFLGWFFGHKRSTYTQVSTVFAYLINRISE